MTYTNEKEMHACKCAEARPESLTDELRKTGIMAADILTAVRRINGHLFGGENGIVGKEEEPRCFREELQKMKHNLLATHEELAKLCVMLGAGT